jgi:hypothetical protein
MFHGGGIDKAFMEFRRLTRRLGDDVEGYLENGVSDLVQSRLGLMIANPVYRQKELGQFNSIFLVQLSGIVKHDKRTSSKTRHELKGKCAV